MTKATRVIRVLGSFLVLYLVTNVPVGRVHVNFDWIRDIRDQKEDEGKHRESIAIGIRLAEYIFYATTRFPGLEFTRETEEPKAKLKALNV